MQTWMSKQDLFDPSQRLRSFLYTGRLEWIRGHFFNDDGKEGDSDLLRTGEREREGVDHCLRELLSHGRGEDALSVLSDVSKKSCGPPRARIVFLLARILLFKNLKRESEAFDEVAAREVSMKARAKAFQILRLEKNGDEMILLFHFMSKGSWNKNRSFTGKGNRTLLSKWFNWSDQYQLVSTRNLNWRVKDLLRMCHVKPVDEVHKVLHFYFLFDFDKTCHHFSDEPSAVVAGVLGFLRSVHKLKTCVKYKADPFKLIRNHYLPAHLIPREVAMLPEVIELNLLRMSAQQLLLSMKSFMKTNLLKEDASPCAQAAVTTLSRTEHYRRESVQPVVPFKCYSFVKNNLAFNVPANDTSYDLGHACLSVQLANLRYVQNHWKTTPFHLSRRRRGGRKGSRGGRRDTEVAGSVSRAIYRAIDICVMNLRPLDRRILICVDTCPEMSDVSCSGAGGLTCLDASVITLMSLLKSPLVQANVYHLCHQIGRQQPAEIEFQKSDGEVDYRRKLQQDCPNRSVDDESMPMSAALANQFFVDSFIFITSKVSNTGDIFEVFHRYRNRMNKEARLVYVAAAEEKLGSSQAEDSHTLMIAGFASSVPSVIANFCSGEF